MLPAGVSSPSPPGSGDSRFADERAARPGPTTHGSEQRGRQRAGQRDGDEEQRRERARSRGWRTAGHRPPRLAPGRPDDRPASDRCADGAPAAHGDAVPRMRRRVPGSRRRRRARTGVRARSRTVPTRCRPVSGAGPGCPGGASDAAAGTPGLRGSADRGDLAGAGGRQRRPGVGVRTAGVGDPRRRARPAVALPRPGSAGRALRLTIRASSRSSPTRTPPMTRSVESMYRT